MFGTTILDVATGLVLVYLVLSLVCSGINEAIAQALGLRAECLWQAVKGLFQNSPKGEEFARAIYGHDLLEALSPATESAKPSYMPSHLFSLALTDHLGIDGPALDGPDRSVLARLDASDADESIKSTLKPLAAAAGDDVDAFRRNVEAWFDEAMRRASGWYKKRVQKTIFFVAFAVVLVCNADTLMLTDTLWLSPGTRAALAATPPPRNATAQSVANAAAPKVAGLLGWSGPIWPSLGGYDRSDPRRFPAGLAEWLTKLVGLLLTAVAAGLGAPFWFDVLNKVANLRSSGGSPDDTTKGSRSGRIASSSGEVDSPPGEIEEAHG